MRVALFTDSYRPQVNGIVYVTEILRRGLETLGHEVYIFAPADSLRVKKHDDDHIIRFPSIQRVPYKDFNVALIFPPAIVKRAKKLNIDVIHFLTPGPVGLMGVYVANKLQIPMVAEYCTDLFEYVDRYTLSLPSIIALGLALPFTLKTSRSELKEILRAWRPRRPVGAWNQEMIKNNLNVLHEHCSAVIVHSRKSAEQLKSWQDETSQYPITIIPTGVDALPAVSPASIATFKLHWGVQPDDEVVQYVGRIGVEKNLDMLIDMINELVKWRPKAKLMFVGDFDYRKELEAKAAASPAASRIVFVGRVPREKLAMAYAVAKVFVFPSLTDTQSLAIHEAARAGLPIVMIDELVTEIVHEAQNGFFASNDAIDVAEKVRQILDDPKLQVSMSAASRRFADEFSELGQCKKVAELYESVLGR
jgi:glycosyltransferase involved in cell wall biosynthesis